MQIFNSKINYFIILLSFNDLKMVKRFSLKIKRNIQ